MLVKKTGIRVVFTHPINKTYEIENADKRMAICMAIDFAKRRYPNKDWKNPQYKNEEYTYEDICLPTKVSNL